VNKKTIQSYDDYQSLVQELIEYDRYYYEKFAPKISDYEYDLLVKQLEEYEKKHLDQILPNSPTQRVEEGVSKGFEQKKHDVPMLSLSNTYSEEELADFIKRIYKLVEKKDVTFCSELKMDGTAVSIRYEKGYLTRAVTRGNGRIGDDVTANIKTIKRLPLKLTAKEIPPLLEIRGEVFMNKKTFLHLNEQKQEKGEEPWANPRNAAAGSLKLLDSKEVSRRKLDIICYGIPQGPKIESQFYIHKYLRDLNIPVSKEEHFAKCKNLQEILDFAHKIQEQREKLSFEIDGIVVKVDDVEASKKLGVTGKSPRSAVAYKFAPEQAFTQIRDITIQVGRTGVLTPVAELVPVHLAGSTISRATLHNQDEIKRKDIRIGDWVIIEKGGDVIPKVVSVDLTKRKKDSSIWNMPDRCPVCGSSLVKREEEVAVRCTNSKCSARKLRKIAFFAGKAAMDIENMGKKVVEQLVTRGFVTRISDIYTLDENILSQMDGFKEKSISNLLKSIEESKQCSLSKFIMGLEIPYIGAETADLLSENYRSVDNLIKAKEEDLLEIEGIGEKAAHAVVSFFESEDNKEEINRLLTHGVNPEPPSKKKSFNPLFDKKIFVLTGSLQKFTRDEASRLIKERGGKVTGSVSKKTYFVLVGEDPGSKYEKAKTLGIKTLSEDEFEKML
jgi:DNA ligase (NAD+)